RDFHVTGVQTCALPILSPATKLLANEVNATYRPSALIAGEPELLLPCTPVDETLTLVVTPQNRSCTKTSSNPFVSPGTKSGDARSEERRVGQECAYLYS